MTNLAGAERARYVQDMFTRIARRYDLMNRVMTAGQDVSWRREVIQRAALPAGGRLLDLGAGTGDLAREALRQHPLRLSLAADFTLEMMHVGKSRPAAPSYDESRLCWCTADAGDLPFPNDAFDAVISGFLLRNITHLRKSLSEQYRVLRPGGTIVCLDTTPPPDNLLKPLVRIHLHTIIPTIGRLLTGQQDAYQYLPDTTENFLEPEQLAERLLTAGFQKIGFHRLMFGNIAIHWGRKPGSRTAA